MLANLQDNVYLKSLNPEQATAVESIEGPVLVLAGAGTGKTRALTTRIAHILNLNKATPGQILAVTFTNKAAKEMGNRVSELVGFPTQGMWIGTFHSLCLRILRQNYQLINYQAGFTILDSDDQIRLLKKILIEYKIDEKRWSPKLLNNYIQSFKDKSKLPSDITIEEVPNFADSKFLDLYQAYQTRLQAINSMDFGDIIMHTIKLLQKNPDVLARYHDIFKYILVDEYQDTNVAQYLWLRLLAQGSGNICCVGDDDQSIYGWRGAEVGNILRFEKDFPGATIVRLERNYRSTGHILEAANGVIANNRGRHDKSLKAETGMGEPVKVKYVWDGIEEAKFIGGEIEALQSSIGSHNLPLQEMAILVRASYQTREFEERFITLGIPYKVVGGLRFYERAEIRDAMAYIRVLVQPENDLAFERIINLPKRGIGKSTLDKIFDYGRKKQISLTDAASTLCQTDELPAKARGAINKLLDNFTVWRNFLKMSPHHEAVQKMLEESGYIGMWKEMLQKDNSLEAQGRLENLNELTKALAEFENLDEFLEHISLVMDNDDGNNNNVVSIMTIHAAKGLEFEAIFLPGWEENLFPSQRSIEEKGTSGLEEERRLAYVAMTRAKRKLYISYAGSRRTFGQWQAASPSRFLQELSEKHIDNLPGNISYRQHDEAGFGSQNKRGVKPKVSVAAANSSFGQDKGLAIGDRVFHIKFGYGFINGAEGETLEINFQKAGRKRVLSDYVKKV